MVPFLGHPVDGEKSVSLFMQQQQQTAVIEAAGLDNNGRVTERLSERFHYSAMDGI